MFCVDAVVARLEEVYKIERFHFHCFLSAVAGCTASKMPRKKVEMVGKKDPLLNGSFLAKNASTASLLTGLTELQSYIANLSQPDDGPPTELDKVSLGLVQDHILCSGKEDVRVLAACCLADILHLYAPSPPYDDAMLIKVFRLFVREMGSGLSDPDAKNFSQHKYLLERLAIVKAFTLLVVLDNSLLEELFSSLFSVVNQSQNSGIWSYCMDIVSSCIEEFEDEIPDDLLEVLLSQLEVPTPYLLPQDQVETTQGYRIVRSLLGKHDMSELQRVLRSALTSYFKTRLQDSEKESFAATLHLLWELFVINSTYIFPIMTDSTLLEKLDSEKDIRSETVRFLSYIFAAPSSTPFAASFASVFTNFLQRFDDTEVEIRKTMVKFGCLFLRHYPELALTSGVRNSLKKRITDSEEDVRIISIKSVVRIAKESPHLSKELLPLLQEIVGRFLDKVTSVRSVAFKSIARFYAHVLHDWQDEGKLKTFHWIPSAILKSYFQVYADIKKNVDQALDLIILGKSKSVEERTGVLAVQIFPSLEAIAFKGFLLLLKDKILFRQEFCKLQQQLLQKAGKKEKLESLRPQFQVVLRRLGNEFVQAKYVTILTKSLSATKKGPRDVKPLFRQLSDPNAEYKKMREALQKIEGFYASSTREEESAESNFILTLAQKLSLTIFPRESIVACMEALRDETAEREFGNYLCEIASTAPELFSGIEDIASRIKEAPTCYLRILSLCKASSTKLKPSLLKTLESFPMKDKYDRKQAVYSVRVMKKFFPNCETSFRSILQGHVKNLKGIFATSSKLDPRTLEKSLGVLGELARLDPASFAPHAKDVVKFITGEVLNNEFLDTISANNEEHSVREVVFLQGQAIKVLLKVIEGLASESTQKMNETAKEIVRSHLKTIFLVLGVELPKVPSSAETIITELEDEEEAAYLARVSSHGLIRVFTKCPEVDHLLSEVQFQSLSHCIVDESIEVSSSFAKDVANGLVSLKLPLRYIATLTLGLYNHAMHSEAKQHLSRAIHKLRDFWKSQGTNDPDRSCQTMPEYSLPYVVHLLAHSGPFSEDDPLTRARTTVVLENFFNELFSGESKFPFVIQLLELLRRVSDAQDPAGDFQEGMYVICDMAVKIVRSKSNKKQWNDPSATPIEARLPTRLFKSQAPGSPKSYLPPNFRLPDHSVRAKILSSPAKSKSPAKSPSKFAQSPAKSPAKSPRAVQKSRKRQRTATEGDRFLESPPKKAKEKEKEEQEQEEEEEEEEEEEVRKARKAKQALPQFNLSSATGAPSRSLRSRRQ